MKRISVFVLFMAFIVGCDTDKNIAPVFETFFTKYYGADGNQESVDMLVNTDGSMILLGNSSSQTSETPIPFIAKIDGNGMVLWQRTLGQSDERSVDVELDRQGNLIIVSNVGSGSASRIRIFRLDQSGNGLDSVMVNEVLDNPFQIQETAYGVFQQSDGRFLISGNAGAGLKPDGAGLPPPDQEDLLIYRIEEDFQSAALAYEQAGEHVGKIVRVFETVQDGETRFLFFGDSDRPFNDTQSYRQCFEVINVNEDGIARGSRPQSGDPRDIQTASTAINTSNNFLESYMLIGTNSTGLKSRLFLAQYSLDANNLTIRNSFTFENARSEGVSASMGKTNDYFILGNSYRDNNLRDILLIKMQDDGNLIGSTTFGSLEGDDYGAAVKVLEDRRVVVLGTIQLETQKKMVLIVISPDGQFTGGS